jgi:hypothetical protein
MSRRSRGPRLWLRRAQYDRAGRLTHAAVWLIKDGQYRKSTGCGADDRRGAEAALAAYISNKHLAEAQAGVRPPAYIPVADVLALYGRDVAPKHSRPRETAQRIAALLGYFGDKVLSDLNGTICRAYVDRRGSIAAARRELEDLRAAINHHRREGLCSAIVEVVLPEPSPARGRWLTREEAARLLWSAWRYREVQKGKPTGRRSRQHIARFILLALYTGTRAGAVCGRTAAHYRPRMDRRCARRVLSPARRRARDEKAKAANPAADGAARPFTALETSGPAVCRRMAWQAGLIDQKGVPCCGRGCWAGPRCYTACTAAHSGDMVDAGWHQSLGGCGLPWNDRRNADEPLRSSPSRLSVGRSRRVLPAP